MNMSSYLAFESVLIGDLAGSNEVFIFIALLAIFFLAAKFRFPNMVIITISLVFLVLFSSIIPQLLIIPIFIISILFGWLIERMVKK